MFYRLFFCNKNYTKSQLFLICTKGCGRKIMKVKYIGKEYMHYLVENNRIDLITGKIYEVIEISQKSGMYRIIDESGEDYLYPTIFFQIIEK